jgi:hypothetical protein
MTVSAASGQLSLGPGARALSELRLTAPAATGSYDLSFQLTSSLGLPVPNVVLPVIVAPPGSLFPYYDNIGISDDSGGGSANFDGDGYSYSAEALAAVGLMPGQPVASSGFTFVWPNVPVATLDDIEASGQAITLAANTGKTTLGLLGSATNAAPTGAGGTLSISFADGSSQSASVAFSDWTLGGGGYALLPGTTIAATCAYRNAGGNRDSTTTYVYSQSIPLTSTQPVTAVTLPAEVSGGQLHVFDVELR